MSIRFTIDLSINPLHRGDDSVTDSTSIEIKLDAGSQIDDPLRLERHVPTLVNACCRAIGERVHDERLRNRGVVRIPHVRQRDMQSPQSVRPDDRRMHANTFRSGQRQVDHSDQDENHLRASRSQRRAIRAICRRLDITPVIAALNHHFSWASLSRQQARVLFDQLCRLEENENQRRMYRRAGALPHEEPKGNSSGA